MIEFLENYGKKIKIEKNKYFIREGFPLNHVYHIVSGTCKITTQSENGNIMSFGFFKENDVLGEVEIFNNQNIATTTVMSVTDMVCIRIPLHISRKLAKENIKYCNFLATSLAIKLTISSNSFTQNILLPLEERLLLYLQQTYPNKIFNGNLIQIAQELGTSYRHLLRVMKKLKEEEILTPSKNKKEFIINI